MNAQNISNLDNRQNESSGNKESDKISQLSQAVKHSIRRYLYELEGTQPSNMYDLVLQQVEQPLFEAILEHTKGNQSKAAEFLGLNRGTLRKKLRAYDLHK